MAATDLESEYNPRARVPDMRRDFCALGARGRALSRRDAQGRPRRARPLLWRHAAADHRSVLAGGGRNRAARAVHPRRILAGLRSVLLQPDGARPEPARHCGCRRRLRSLPDRHHRRHHRANPPRLHFPVAALRPADAGLRAFGRRPSCRRHGRDRLAGALSRRRRPIWCRPALRFPACSISRRW